MSRPLGIAGVFGNVSTTNGATLISVSSYGHGLRRRSTYNEQHRADACSATGAPVTPGLRCRCRSRRLHPAAASAPAAAAINYECASRTATLNGLMTLAICPASALSRPSRCAKSPRPPISARRSAHWRSAGSGDRPTAKTPWRRLIRWDLTCRSPGCDRAAERSDIDHTVPWQPRADASVEHQALLSHPSPDEKRLAVAPVGEPSQQLPDGAIILTAPTGHVSAREPHGAAMFPALADARRASCTSRPTLRTSRHQTESAMMPRRKQTPRTGSPETASTPNAANAPNSSPKKNANAKPGSRPTTNHPLLTPATHPRGRSPRCLNPLHRCRTGRITPPTDARSAETRNIRLTN